MKGSGGFERGGGGRGGGRICCSLARAGQGRGMCVGRGAGGVDCKGGSIVRLRGGGGCFGRRWREIDGVRRCSMDGRRHEMCQSCGKTG